MDTVGEVPDRKLFRSAAQVQWIEAYLHRFVNRLHERGRPLAVRVEHAVPPVLDDVEHPAALGRHHRHATGQRLDGGDPEVLDPGLEEQAGAAIKGAQALRADLPEEARPRPAGPLAAPPAGPLEAPPLGAAADDAQLEPQAVAGGDGDLETIRA